MISSIIYFVIALSILVFVHELGHFLVAKRAGIRVERFSVGYPPKLFGFQWGETEYCISAIPFGGYVKVAGMADVGTEESTGEPWEFPSKPIWIRLAVIAAGPIMNFIFAFFAFLVLFYGFGFETVDSTAIAATEDSAASLAGVRHGDVVLRVDNEPVANQRELLVALEARDGALVYLDVDRSGRVLTVEIPASDEPGYGLRFLVPTTVGTISSAMPAEAAGLVEGDRITAVNGVAVTTWSQMRAAISVHPDESIRLAWDRGGRTMQIDIIPEARTIGDTTVGLIGISPYYSTAEVGFGEAIELSAGSVYTSSWLILDFIREIFREDRYKELGGPIRIAMLAGDTAERGLKYFISFLALLSVNLAILNLLPIPVLDGGHITFLTLEAVMRRPLSVRQREFFQQIGLVIILGIMALVTFNDLNQLVFHHIVELFQ